MREFSLNEGWTVEYMEPETEGFELASHTPQKLDDISEWTCHFVFTGEDVVAEFVRGFELEAADFCVGYAIKIVDAPESLRVRVNQKWLEFDAAVGEMDVTNYVALGYNRLFLQVNCGEAPQIGGVLLVQVPCE